ncbi:MAG: TlpA family protein disulfide reductase [Burkholderiales bacterium]
MRRFIPVVFVIAVLAGVLAPLAGAADFALTDSNGKVHRLSDYRGKWVVVNFWATWCAPCLEEIPDLVALKDAHKNLQVLGVAIEFQDGKQVLQFAEGMFVNYPIILGTGKDVEQVGSVKGLPTTYVFNPAGKMVKRKLGKITRKQIEKLMADLPGAQIQARLDQPSPR